MGIKTDLDKNTEIQEALGCIPKLHAMAAEIKSWIAASAKSARVGNRGESMLIIRDCFIQAGTYTDTEIKKVYEQLTGTNENTLPQELIDGTTAINNYYNELESYQVDLKDRSTIDGVRITQGDLTTTQRNDLTVLLDAILAVF